MCERMISKLCAGILPIFLSSAAQAATISLTPSSPTVASGGQLTLDLNMDFTGDPTLGGGLDIFYNGTVFDFVSFTFNPDMGDTASSRRQPDDQPSELNGLAFGNDSGMTGPVRVGTLVFDVLGPPQAFAFTMADNDAPAGAFFSSATFEQQSVLYEGALVNIVPLPAAAWLVFSGVGLLGMMGRRHMSV